MVKNKYFIAIIFAGILAILAVQTVFAISPAYLISGRTFDQERDYIKWNGSVSHINLYHRDGTSLPPSEGGGSCSSGCTEQVTRIQDGASISGNFTRVRTINAQVATTGKEDAGTALIRACGQIIAEINLYKPGGGTPGFNNIPNPAWNVPTSGDCIWSITAVDGYVDFRAITVSYLPVPLPSVDIQINNTQGPLTQTVPGGYTLTWSSTNAFACTASGNWIGTQSVSGTQVYTNMPGGIYTYTLTCSNPYGSATDSVTANVVGPLSVDVKVNDLDGPLTLFAPAAYTVTWSSSNASSCQAEGNLTSLIGVNGSQTFNTIPPGTYTYIVRCLNPFGAQVVDSVQVRVDPRPPIVDLKVDGVNGPITRNSPASFILSWTSQYATGCSTSSTNGHWTGEVLLSGNRGFHNIPMGTHTYTITCVNASGNASDSVTVFVVTPLSGAIVVTFPRLPLFAPTLGLPAQTISGTVVGGGAPFSIIVHIRAPSGVEMNLSRSGSTWVVNPENSGDRNLGTTEQGIWTAWADLTDSAGQTYRTPSAIWEVAWYPVHGRP